MRRFLIASALGLGILSGGAASGTAEAAPFNPGQVELGVGVTPVQHYRHGHYRRHHHHHYRPRYYAPPPRYYAPPRHYGYYGPPPRGYYRPHHHRPYYGWR